MTSIVFKKGHTDPMWVGTHSECLNWIHKHPGDWELVTSLG